MTNAIANTTGRPGYFNTKPFVESLAGLENAEYNAAVAQVQSVFNAANKAAKRLDKAVRDATVGTKSAVLNAAAWANNGRGQYPFCGPESTVTVDGVSFQVRVRVTMLRLSAVTEVQVNLKGTWTAWMGYPSAEYVRDMVSRMPSGPLNLSTT